MNWGCLEQLQHYHYVTHDNDGWLLKTNPYEINLRDVFEIFVYRPSTKQNDPIGSMVQNCAASLSRRNHLRDRYIV